LDRFSVLEEESRVNKETGLLILGRTVLVAFVLLAAQFLATPVGAFAPPFSAGSVSSSYSAPPTVTYSTLTSPNAQPVGEFGWSVAASGNIVVVGAPFETAHIGHAYTFNAKTGALISTLTSPQSGGLFGISVAASGHIVVVGEAGHAYTFNAETGALISTLTSPNTGSGGSFGLAVAASGHIVVVGAGSEVNGPVISGHAYIFE
jgi:outer membrane protein assembly factor BamB